MRRLSALTVLLCLLLVPAARAADPAATTRAVKREMAKAGRSSGALVVDLSNGVTLYKSRADTPRIPASVNKLNTTITALRRFGPSAQYSTPVLATTAPDAAGVVAGDLWLRGEGDPTLGRTAIDVLAQRVVAAGVTAVTGRVKVDETLFDTRRGPSSLRASDWVLPLSAVGYGFPRSIDPATTAGNALAAALRRRGVQVPRSSAKGKAPAGAPILASIVSPTMAQLAAMANVPSDNYIAEMLTKSLGARFGGAGTTYAGARVTRRTLGSLGIPARIADGSGLSRSNRITPRAVVGLLHRMAGDPLFGVFEGSLPVAGRSGTLVDRLRGTPAQDRCRAKTGSLIGVSALAGYCTARGGARVAFAFLMNGVSTWGARTLQDRMVATLARYDGGSRR